MKDKIIIYRPSIKRKDLEYVLNCMMDENLNYGEFAKNFENRLVNRMGSGHVVAINSYYMAFSLILEALEIRDDDEIIMPSFLPQMFLNAVLVRKARPVLVDLEKNALRPSIDSVKAAVTPKTKALLLFYYFGYSFDPTPYLELVPNVIEDITSLLGTKLQETTLGLAGRFALADFSPKSIITTGEGAAIFCGNKSNFTAILSLIEKDYPLEYRPRYACLMPDLNAAMGVSQDESLNRRLELRKQIGQIYEEAVRRSRGCSFIQEQNSNTGAVSSTRRPDQEAEENNSTRLPAGNRCYSDFPILIKSGLKEAIKYFKNNEVESVRPYDYPLHHYLNLPKNQFPQTEFYYLNTLLVPLYSSLLKKEVDLIAKIIASLI